MVLKNQNFFSLTSHLKKAHNITKEDYYNKFCKTPNEGNCLTCGKPTLFKNFSYSNYCSNSCAIKHPITQDHLKETKKERYGDENYNNIKQNKETKKKKYGDENYNNRILAKKTTKEHYGVEFPLQDKNVFDKHYKTKIEKYGDYVSDDMILKGKKTKKEKYGDENYVNVSKCKETKKKLYGDENYNNIEQNKETKKKKYGDENYNNIEQAKKTKIKNNGSYITANQIELANKTKLKRYGSINLSYKYKCNNLHFDSSWELAYYIWLMDHNVNFEFHPKHKEEYKYTFNNKIHYYEPDFKVENELVELKNEFLYKKLLQENTKDHAKFLKMKELKVKILRQTDCIFYLDYVKNTYGKNYLIQFKHSIQKIK